MSAGEREPALKTGRIPRSGGEAARSLKPASGRGLAASEIPATPARTLLGAPIGYTQPGTPAAPTGYTSPGAPAAPTGYTLLFEAGILLTSWRSGLCRRGDGHERPLVIAAAAVIQPE